MMGKRSSFQRRPMDDYATPFEAVVPLIPHLKADGIRRFAEPCCGECHLVRHLERHGFQCVLLSDIEATNCDALTISDFNGADAIITNPPWTRTLLHPLIMHFSKHKPTWLLFDADWAHTIQARLLLPLCTDIVAIGRVRWIPNSPFTGKDNAAWYRFQSKPVLAPVFHGRKAA